MSRRIGIASLIWSLSILLSRVIALARAAAIGRVLGTSGDADVYFVAFVLPDFLNYLLAGGALSLVFIPIFGEHLARGETEAGWDAFSAIANFLVAVIGVLLPVLWIAVPYVVPHVAPGFSDEQRGLLVALTRIMLPAQLFHLVGGLLSATLQARDQHALPALAPLVYNACIVLGGLAGGHAIGAYGFAWGVLVGSILGPFALPLVGCLRADLRWRPILSFRNRDLRTYLVRSLPIMLGWSIVVVDDWILKIQGALIGAGVVSTLQYGKELTKVPMGVFGLATGVAAYPTLTRLVSQGQRAEAYTTLATAVRRMLVLALAAQVVFTCAGPEIARVIYGGRITPGQHAEIGLALAIFSVSLWAWAAHTVVARGFYAIGNTWFPTVLGTALVPLAFPLYTLLRERYGAIGLASASSIAISVYVGVLMIALRRRFPEGEDRYLGFFARMVAAVGGSIALGLWARGALEVPLAALPTLARGAVYGLLPLAAYALLLVVLRVDDALAVLELVRRRLLRRSRPG